MVVVVLCCCAAVVLGRDKGRQAKRWMELSRFGSVREVARQKEGEIQDAPSAYDENANNGDGRAARQQSLCLVG